MQGVALLRVRPYLSDGDEELARNGKMVCAELRSSYDWAGMGRRELRDGLWVSGSG